MLVFPFRLQFIVGMFVFAYPVAFDVQLYVPPLMTVTVKLIMFVCLGMTLCFLCRDLSRRVLLICCRRLLCLLLMCFLNSYSSLHLGFRLLDLLCNCIGMLLCC